MTNRTLFKWVVPIQSDRGEVEDCEFASYWSPEDERTRESVARSAAATRSARTDRKWFAVGEPRLLDEQA